jgi:Zn-finger nucleic acid-binding protein
MKCPNCQVEMNQVKAAGLTKGYFVQIDQCPKCGGIWCDRYEMTQISADDAFKIDSLDHQLLKKPFKAMMGELSCPKDNLSLIAFNDQNLPQGLQIMRCRKCEGMWLNHGILSRFKQNTQKKKDELAKIYKEKEYFWGHQGKVYHSPNLTRITNNMAKVIAGVTGFILPVPFMGYLLKEESPFVIGDAGVELLKAVPPEKKKEIIQLMAKEYNQTEEKENNFINATFNVFKIIYTLIKELI